MSEIKKRIIDTISEHIDQQNAKGMETYGKRLEDCDLNDYNWQHEVIQELIDALQYEHMAKKKLMNDLKTAEAYGEMYRLRYIQLREGGVQ